MADQYEADLPRVNKYGVKLRLLFKFRHLNEFLSELESAVPFLDKTAKEYNIASYAYKAHAQVMLGDIHGAEESLLRAQDILSKILLVPAYQMFFSIPQSALSLHQWEGSIIQGLSAASAEYRKRAGEAIKELVKNAPKVAFERTEAYKLVGTYHWLAGRQRKALKWWGRSIAEGERLHARPELARSYMEVGKRLLEPKSKYRELNGVKAEEYLEKARTLFEEMDLQWDLNELEKVKTAV